jgi:hypothetical protein
MKSYTATIYLSIDADNEEDARGLAFGLEDIIVQADDKGTASINGNAINIEVEEETTLR